VERAVTRLAAFLPLLTVACSGSLPRELAKLDPDLSCPGPGPVEVSRTAPLAAMQCLLRDLRAADERTLESASLASRACFFLADSTRDRDRARLFASEGVRWAEIATEKGAGTDGRVRYFLALNLGLAVKDTVVLALKNLDRLKAELEAANRLAPDQDGGGPGRVLALLYLKAPAWPNGFGDPDLSVEMLRKAIEAHPEHPLNTMFLALALWDTQESAARDEVASLLQRAEKAIAAGDWGYASALWQEQIAELRKEAGL
jgi:hypothetical protein